MGYNSTSIRERGGGVQWNRERNGKKERVGKREREKERKKEKERECVCVRERDRERVCKDTYIYI